MKIDITSPDGNTFAALGIATLLMCRAQRDAADIVALRRTVMAAKSPEEARAAITDATGGGRLDTRTSGRPPRETGGLIMSAPVKSKEDLTRLAWITELRRQGDRQCYGSLFNGGYVCALGLLGEIAGFSGNDIYIFSLEEIGALAGLSGEHVGDIVIMNDGDECPFSEIADTVEGWFK